MKLVIYLLVCVVVLVSLNSFSIIGLAQYADDILLVDDAQIYGDKFEVVEAAAKKLLNLGAEIRIRTITTYGSAGNLDQYETQLEKQNPSWTGSDGKIKNNLIVLIISLQERQTGLYYGSYWENSLADKWLTIQTQKMNPLFQEGDYAGGTIRGLEEIRLIIEGTTKTQTVTQTGSGQSTGLAIVIIVIVILGLGIGLFLFLNFRKKRAEQLAIRQKALLSKQAAASGINELLETTQMLEIKVNVVGDKVAQDESSPLKNGLEKVKTLVNRSSQHYSELSHSAGDPENPRLEAAQLTVIQGEYQKIVDDLRQARDSIKEVEERITEIQQLTESYPVKVAEVNTLIEDARKKQNDLKDKGFNTAYIIDMLTRGQNTLVDSQSLVQKKQLKAGMKQITLASDQIKQAIQATDDLPRKKLEVETAIPALESRIAQVKMTINTGRESFERMFQSFSESNWESVKGNGTEAENRVNWALGALNDARETARPDQQDWYKTLEIVTRGNTWLSEAESLIKSIYDIESNLKKARLDAPGEIEAAKADVARAWDYINRYDEDIRESLEDDLRSAEQKNELAREELRKEKPDYFKACKLAREANESADKILIQARDEHENAERLRSKASSALRDAGARVSIARKYIQDHHPVVRSEARNNLVNADDALRQAQTASETNSQIALAERAEASANKAYALAQKDVSSTNVNIPPIVFPTPGQTSQSSQPWGSFRPGSSNRPSSSNRPESSERPGASSSRPKPGGGSSSWSSARGSSDVGGKDRGGGSTGW